MSLSNELLGVYLNEHLAGSAAGVELANKLRSDSKDSVAFFTRLADDIEADKASLEELMERLGVARSPVKQAGASAFEKVGRLRFHPRVTGSGGLSRFMEMEVLSLGIEGKLALWKTLQKVADRDPALAASDLDGLADRAQHQLDDLEQHRLAAAAAAFEEA